VWHQNLLDVIPKLTPAPCAKLQNGKVSIDVQCSCKRNNSCLNGQLSSLGASMDFGGVNLADPIRMLNAMNGQFDSAQLENFAGQLNARSKNLLGKINIADIPSTNVTEEIKRSQKNLIKWEFHQEWPQRWPINPQLAAGVWAVEQEYQL
jgi:hypothetical protein